MLCVVSSQDLSLVVDLSSVVGMAGAHMSFMQAACVLALLGLVALCAPAADARQLKQSSDITDADILNFALNLEVTTVSTRILNCLSSVVPVLMFAESQVSGFTVRLNA